MIEIKILDPHLFSKNLLLETAKYLEALSNIKHPLDDIQLIDRRTSQEPAIISSESEPTHVFSESTDSPPEFTIPKPPVPNIPTQSLEMFETYELIESEITPSIEPETVEIPDAKDVFKSKLENHEVIFDSKGDKWDARIHARTKTKNNDGTWRYRRDVSKKLIEKVENELNPSLSIPVPPLPSVPQPPEQKILDPEETLSFQNLMQLISGSLASGELKREDVARITTSYGIPSLPLLSNRPELIKDMYAKIKELIRA